MAQRAAKKAAQLAAALLAWTVGAQELAGSAVVARDGLVLLGAQGSIGSLFVVDEQDLFASGLQRAVRIELSKTQIGKRAIQEHGVSALEDLSIDLANDTIAVGIPDVGSVVILQRNTGGPNNWGLSQVIDAPPSTAGLPRFGNRVAFCGSSSSMVVSTGSQSDVKIALQAIATDPQAVAVFDKDENGTYHAGALVTPFGSAEGLDGFGDALACSSEALVVSAAPKGRSEQVFVFERSEVRIRCSEASTCPVMVALDWFQVATFLQRDQGQSAFGRALATAGDVIAVASNTRTHIFRRNSTSELPLPDAFRREASTFHRDGAAVDKVWLAASRNTVLVRTAGPELAPSQGGQAAQQSRAFRLLRNAGWADPRPLGSTPQPTPDSLLGRSQLVALLSEQVAVFGEPGKDLGEGGVALVQLEATAATAAPSASAAPSAAPSSSPPAQVNEFAAGAVVGLALAVLAGLAALAALLWLANGHFRRAAAQSGAGDDDVAKVDLEAQSKQRNGAPKQHEPKESPATPAFRQLREPGPPAADAAPQTCLAVEVVCVQAPRAQAPQIQVPPQMEEGEVSRGSPARSDLIDAVFLARITVEQLDILAQRVLGKSDAVVVLQAVSSATAEALRVLGPGVQNEHIGSVAELDTVLTELGEALSSLEDLDSLPTNSEALAATPMPVSVARLLMERELDHQVLRLVCRAEDCIAAIATKTGAPRPRQTLDSAKAARDLDWSFNERVRAALACDDAGSSHPKTDCCHDSLSFASTSSIASCATDQTAKTAVSELLRWRAESSSGSCMPDSRAAATLCRDYPSDEVSFEELTVIDSE